MINQQHSITPPPELVKKLQDLGNLDAIAFAYQAGADQELEACHCEVSFWGGKGMADRLQATRRPKTPSLKEQALEALERQSVRSIPSLVSNNDCDTIRRALEQLDD